MHDDRTPGEDEQFAGTASGGRERFGGYWVVADASGVAFSPQADDPGPLPPVRAMLPGGRGVRPEGGRFVPRLPRGSRIYIGNSLVHTVSAPPVERNVLWSHLAGAERPLLERLQVGPHPHDARRGHQVTVDLLGVVAGAPTSASLQMTCEKAWSPISWRLAIHFGIDPIVVSRVTGSAEVVRESLHACGTSREASPLPDAAFPVFAGSFASHLPILNWSGAGDDFEVAVLRVTLGNGQPVPSVRRYERVRDRRWRFRDIERADDEGEVAVDGDGVVVEQDGTHVLVPTRFPRPSGSVRG